MSYAFGPEQIDGIEEVLQNDLMNLGVHSVVFIDTAGNIITHLDNGEMGHNIYSLAALAAGNFGAMSSMAKMIGEKEFTLLFHKGIKENLHFSKVSTDFLLVTIFGNEVTLGFLRLKVAEAIEKIDKLLEPSLA